MTAEAEEWEARRRLAAAAGRCLPPAPIPVRELVAVGAAVWDGWIRLEEAEVFVWADPGIWPDLQAAAFWRSVYATRRLRPGAAFLVVPADDHPGRRWRWEVRLRARRTPVALALRPAAWWAPEGWRRWGIWRGPGRGTPDPPPPARWGMDPQAPSRRHLRLAGRVLEDPEGPAALALLLRMGGVAGWWRTEELVALWGEAAAEAVRAAVRLGLAERVGAAVRPTPAGQALQRRLMPEPGGRRRRRNWGVSNPDAAHARLAAEMLARLRAAGWDIRGGGREVLLAGRGTYAVPDAVALAWDARGRAWLWVLEVFRDRPEGREEKARLQGRLARLQTLLRDAPPDLRVGIWIRGPLGVLRAALAGAGGRLRWHLGEPAPDPAADRWHVPAALRM